MKIAPSSYANKSSSHTLVHTFQTFLASVIIDITRNVKQSLHLVKCNILVEVVLTSCNQKYIHMHI